MHWIEKVGLVGWEVLVCNDSRIWFWEKGKRREDQRGDGEGCGITMLTWTMSFDFWSLRDVLAGNYVGVALRGKL